MDNELQAILVDCSQPKVIGESGIVYQQEYNPDNGTIGWFTHAIVVENSQLNQPGQGE